MGTLASEKIKNISNVLSELKEITLEKFDENCVTRLSNCTNIVSIIGELILKNYLQQEIDNIKQKFDLPNFEKLKKLYKMLPESDKKRFNDYSKED